MPEGMFMVTALRLWEAASIGYFAYIAAAAIAIPTLTRAARARALALSAAGLLLALVSMKLPQSAVLHGWVVPPLLLLIGYWSSGVLFTGPMLGVERVLQQFDRALQIRRLSARSPRLIAELLELSYAAVYPMVPIGLALYTSAAAQPTPARHAERFWAVILLVDYVCFATLPWIQTRPPRQLEPGEPWNATLRSMNLRLVNAASIRVNTFPSGHAAEAFAVALMTLEVSPGPVGFGMLLAAVAVSAGAVLGRYHYAADALSGWLVAGLVVFSIKL